MKKKIKTWLIHLLGGVTVSEMRQSNFNSACFGKHKALAIIKEYADSVNGKTADEWCELVYKQICRQLDSVSMELTKKDQRHIRNLAAADVFKVVDHASE